MGLKLIRDIAIDVAGVLGLCALHLVVILVHECGHMAAASLLGLRCNRVAVGPFAWERNNGISFTPQFKHSVDGSVLAQFAALPARAWKAFLFVAAGPVFSAAAALAAAPYADYARVKSAIPAIFMLDSAFVAFVCLVPMRMRDGDTSDGYKMWALIFSKRERSRLLYILSVRARFEAMKAHWQRREFEPVLRILDEMTEYSREDPAIVANEQWQAAMQRLRAAALNGVEAPNSIHLECADAEKVQPASA